MMQRTLVRREMVLRVVKEWDVYHSLKISESHLPSHIHGMEKPYEENTLLEVMFFTSCNQN